MSTLFFMDETHEWLDLGNCVTDVSISAESDSGDAVEVPKDPYPFYAQRWVTGMTESFTMSFELKDIDLATLELIYDMPFHPRKRKGLTGTAYRQACRAYQRRLKAHKRGEDWRGVS